MQLSSRISQLQASPTVALNDKAKSLKLQGIEVLNFAVGEPDFGTPESVVEIAIDALKKGKTRYGPAGGSLELRKAISDKLKTENELSYTPDEVVCGIGAKELLFHAFLALLNEGDEVLLPAPFWVSYADQIKASGGVPVVVPIAEDFFRNPVDPARLEDFVTSRTRGLVINSPSNPAGYVLSNDRLRQLAELAKARDLWIISDEIYEYLAFDAPHRSIGALCPEIKDRLLLINGLSKGFAMTGWRVGYVAGASPVVTLIKRLQSHSSTCLPPFIDAAATFAVSHGKGLMAREQKLLRNRRDFLEVELAKLPHLRWSPPQGAFYTFLDVREFLQKSSQFSGTDTLAFGEFLLTEHHMALVPGEAFGTPGFLRMSYATSETVLAEGAARLKAVLSHD